jgi:hypothetical protein
MVVGYLGCFQILKGPYSKMPTILTLNLENRFTAIYPRRAKLKII